MAKVHLTGIPCKAGSMWGCKVLTSIKNPDKVTCKTCLRIISLKESKVAELDANQMG